MLKVFTALSPIPPIWFGLAFHKQIYSPLGYFNPFTRNSTDFFIGQKKPL